MSKTSVKNVCRDWDSNCSKLFNNHESRLVKFIATDLNSDNELKMLFNKGANHQKHLKILKSIYETDFAGRSLQLFKKRVKIHMKLDSNVNDLFLRENQHNFSTN